jgi:hypothetical protein
LSLQETPSGNIIKYVQVWSLDRCAKIDRFENGFKTISISTKNRTKEAGENFFQNHYEANSSCVLEPFEAA